MVGFKENLGEAIINIRATTGKLRQDLSKAQTKVKSSTKKMAGSFTFLRMKILAVAAAVTAIAFAVTRLVNRFDMLAKEAQRIGLSAEAFQRLRFMADLSGVSIEELRTAFATLTRNLSAANSGTGEMVKLFQQLEAASGRTINTLNRQQAFDDIVKALGNINDETLRAQLSLRILGESGQRLLPLISNYDELNRRAKNFTVVTNENSAAIERFKDAVSALITQLLNVLGNALGFIIRKIEEMLPILDRIIERFNRFAEMIGLSFRLKSFKEMADGLALISKESNKTTNAVNKTGLSLLGLKAKFDSLMSSVADKIVSGDFKGMLKSILTFIVESALSTMTGMLQATQSVNQVTQATQVASKGFDAMAQSAKKAAADISEAFKAAGTGSALGINISGAGGGGILGGLISSIGQGALSLFGGGFNFQSLLPGLATNVLQDFLGPNTMGLSTPIQSAAAGMSMGFIRGATMDIPGLGAALFSGFGGFADGGRPPIGQPSIVGERGPELFIPDSAGTVIPNEQLGGGLTVNVSPTFIGVDDRIQEKIDQKIPDIVQASVNAVSSRIGRGDKRFANLQRGR